MRSGAYRAGAAVVTIAFALVSTTAAGSAASSPLTVVFRGSYSLDSHAAQRAFDPSSRTCIPASRLHETEHTAWTITFAGAIVRGATQLRQTRAVVSGTHVWDERSAACSAYPAGHLLCRSRLTAGPSTLEIDRVAGRWIFHPRLTLVAVGEGCSGLVYNEHPDCGARDRTAVDDFGFDSDLRGRAPQLRPPARTASFDVRRSAACRLPGPEAQPGSRNPNEVRQRTVVSYRGTLTLGP